MPKLLPHSALTDRHADEDPICIGVAVLVMLVPSPSEPWDVPHDQSVPSLLIARTCAFVAAPILHESAPLWVGVLTERSEERRVGKELVSKCRSRRSPYHKKKK